MLSLYNYKVSPLTVTVSAAFIQRSPTVYWWQCGAQCLAQGHFNRRGSRIKPPTLQLTCSTNRSTAATQNSSSYLTVNLSSAGVGHLTDAHSVLLREPEVSSFLEFLQLNLSLLPDLSALCALHFICYVCLWTLLCYRL